VGASLARQLAREHVLNKPAKRGLHQENRAESIYPVGVDSGQESCRCLVVT
jgi:hypothetical protein